MFTVVNLEPPHQVAFKCTPESFGELVERTGIIPAPSRRLISRDPAMRGREPAEPSNGAGEAAESDSRAPLTPIWARRSRHDRHAACAGDLAFALELRPFYHRHRWGRQLADDRGG